jgi:hypothetical protein
MAMRLRRRPMRRGTSAGLLAVAVAVSFFWLIRIVPGKQDSFATLDLHVLYLPAYDLGARWIARVLLPLWNPYGLCGIPWVAALQEGFFYPPHVLYLLLPAPTALAVSTFLHLVLLAVSTTFFARRAGLGVAAAVLAGLLSVIRGINSDVAAIAPVQFEALVWLPLGAIGVLDLARRASPRAVALLALATALSILAGFPQSTAYLVYAWAALFVVLVACARPSLRRGLVAIGCLMGGLGVGMLGGAMQLLPALELLALGSRTSEPLDPFKMFPVGGPLFGNPALQVLREAIAGSRMSFGVVGLALAVAAPFSAAHRGLAIWAIGWGGLSLMFALGPVTPLFDVYLALPSLAWFRSPDRILSVTDFAFAIAAAIGLDAVLAARRGRIEAGAGASVRHEGPMIVTVLGLVALSGLVLLGVCAPFRRWPSVLIAAGSLLSLVIFRGSGHLALGGTLIALAAAEVFVTPRLDARLPYTSSRTHMYRRHERAFAALAQLAGPDRVWIFNRRSSSELAQKLAGLHGLRSFDDYEPVNPLRQLQYFTYLIDATTTVERWPWVFAGNLVTLTPNHGTPAPATRRRLLDLAAVRFVAFESVDLQLAEVRDFVAATDLRRLPPLPGEGRTLRGTELVVFENPHVLPRAFVVYRTQPAPPVAELLARISRSDFDPLVESYVEGGLGGASAAVAVTHERGVPAVIARDEEQRVDVAATLTAPGLLVLADSFYPGWKATVNGVPVPILPTNHLFRGVPLPAGVHIVRFDYRPWSFRLGVTASLLGFALIILLWWRGRDDTEP